MKKSVKSLLIAAAMTGMLAATCAPMAMADDKPAATDSKSTTKTKKASTKKASGKQSSANKDKKAKDKNSCKSANGCSGM